MKVTSISFGWQLLSSVKCIRYCSLRRIAHSFVSPFSRLKRRLAHCRKSLSSFAARIKRSLLLTDAMTDAGKQVELAWSVSTRASIFRANLTFMERDIRRYGK